MRDAVRSPRHAHARPRRASARRVTRSARTSCRSSRSCGRSVTGSAGERVLKELHGELALRRKLREPRIAAQLVAPDFRIDLGTDRLAAELAREARRMPTSSPRMAARRARSRTPLDALLASEHAFPGVGFFERREVAKLAEAAGETRRVVGRRESRSDVGLWRHLAAIALRHPAPPPIAIARAVDAWRTGPAVAARRWRRDPRAVRREADDRRRRGPRGHGHRARRVVGQDLERHAANGDEIGAARSCRAQPPAELAELLGKKAPKRLAELAEACRSSAIATRSTSCSTRPGCPSTWRRRSRSIARPTKEPSGDAAFSIHSRRDRRHRPRDRDDRGRARRAKARSQSDRLAGEVHGAACRAVAAPRRGDAVLRASTSCSRTRRSKRRRRRCRAVVAATTCRATCRSR